MKSNLEIVEEEIQLLKSRKFMLKKWLAQSVYANTSRQDTLQLLMILPNTKPTKGIKIAKSI